MTYVFAALTGGFAVAYALVRRDGSLLSRVFFKCAASVMFVLTAYSARIGAPDAYYGLIMGGLCASLAGDVALLFTDRGGGFATVGGVAFAAAHMLYISAFWTIASPSWADAIFFAMLIALVAGLLHGYVKRERRNLLIYAYAALLCAMAAKALALLWAAALPPLFSAFAAAGGVAFAVSDLLLGAEHRTDSRAAGSASIIVYYAAQVLIALTVISAPK